MKNYGIIIEARTGSTRFPNKVIKKIGNLTLLDYLIDRVKYQNQIKKIIIATTKKKKDNKIIKIAKKNKINFFRGSENDLIDRISRAAKKNNIENIIQVTADNPFFDIDILKKLLKKFKTRKYDFVSNSLNSSFPIGSDIRIFSLSSLLKYSYFVRGQARQHTCYFFLKNSEKVRTYNLKAQGKYRRPNYRLTVDFKNDFELVKKIIIELGFKYYGLKKIINLLDKNKKMIKINSNLPKKIKIQSYKY
tara:strand:+ start:3659 stop:4402 length:744 start_codon:yes stop_codon:yes gene_type:complete